VSEPFTPFHQHLLVKCWVKNPPRTEAEVNRWLINLVHTVGMKVVAGPTSVHVSEPGNEGVTGTITLATSHASIHVWDALDPALIQFDIYSCKCFELKQVMDCFNDWEIVNYDWIMIDRNEGLEVVAEGTYFKNETLDLLQNED